MTKIFKWITTGYKTMDNLKDIFEKVRYYNNNGQSQTAFELLANTSNNDLNLHKDIIFNLEMGQTLLGMTKFNEAFECFQKVLDSDKNNIHAQKGKIKILYKLNKKIDIASIRKIFKADENDTDIKNIFANILMMNKQYDVCLSLTNDPLYCLKHAKCTDKKQVISAIKYIINNMSILDKNSALFETFTYIVSNKMKTQNNISNDMTNIILNYIHILDYNNQKDTKEYLFNHYRQTKSYYETLKYLFKIIKLDDTKDIFFDIFCTTLKESNLTTDEKNKIIYKLNVLRKKSKNLKFQNILLNEREILQKKTVLKSKPRKIHALLTTACNLNCIMCYIPRKNLGYEISKKFTDFIENNIPYLETITWQGGEVFLHHEFKKLFELAGKHDVKQNIITSGLLLTKEIIDSIMQYDTDLTISIDSAESQTYEKIRCGANFKKLLENLELLKKHKNKKNFNYHMTSVIMSLNYNQLDSLVNFAISYGFNLISFQKIICNNDNKFLAITEKQETEIFKNVTELKEKYKNSIKIQTDISVEEQSAPCELIEIEKKDIKKENINNDDTLFCFAPWTQLFFDFDNVVKIDCNSMPLMLASKGGIWNNENIVTYRKGIVDKKFTYCNQFCYDNADHKKKTEKFKDIQILP